MSVEREAAALLVEAVRAVDDEGTFGEGLALIEAGSLLGAIGEALSEGADGVAELRLTRLLRLRRQELEAVAGDLADAAEPPWPAVREALLAAA